MDLFSSNIPSSITPYNLALYVCLTLELWLALIKAWFDSQAVFGKCVLVWGTRSADLMRALQSSLVNWVQWDPCFHSNWSLITHTILSHNSKKSKQVEGVHFSAHKNGRKSMKILVPKSSAHTFIFFFKIRQAVTKQKATPYVWQIRQNIHYICTSTFLSELLLRAWCKQTVLHGWIVNQHFFCLSA